MGPCAKEGYQAFAAQQSALCVRMRDHLTQIWRYVDNFVLMGGKGDILPPETIQGGDE